MPDVVRTVPINRLALRFRGAAIGLALAAQSAVAPAQVVADAAAPYQLRWSREPGAESCIEGAALSQLLDQLLASAGRETTGSRLVLEASAAPAAAPRSFLAHVRVFDGQGGLIGERELSTLEPNCSALTSALLLVLAMSVDPNVARDGMPVAVTEALRRDAEQSVTAKATRDGAPVAAVAGSDEIKPAAPSFSPPRPLRPAVETAPSHAHSRQVQRADAVQDGQVVAPERLWSLVAALALSTHILPEVSPGIALSGRRLLPPTWSLSLSTLAWLPRTASVDSPRAQTAGVSFGAAQALAMLCWRPLAKPAVAVDVCAGGQFSLRWISAAALAQQYEHFRPYYGPVLGVEATYAMNSPWLLRGGVDFACALRRDQFAYVDQEAQEHVLFVESRFSGWAFLGIGVTL